jgi:hypothetical protein
MKIKNKFIGICLAFMLISFMGNAFAAGGYQGKCPQGQYESDGKCYPSSTF